MVLGRGINQFFTKVFVILILNLMFWLYTLLGLVVLGIGPALRVISELFAAHEWAFGDYHMAEAWQLFKQYFRLANGHFWLFGALAALLSYSLYLSTQLPWGFVVFIQFIIIFAILLTIVAGLFTLALESHYEVQLKLAIKLAVGQFFHNFMQLLVFVMGLLAIVMITVKIPGLIPFVSVAAAVIWTHLSSQHWYAQIDAQLA